MKITVEDITRDDLIKLFSGIADFNDCNIRLNYKRNNRAYSDADVYLDLCLEKCVDYLLKGKQIYIIDNKAKDCNCHFGILPYEWSGKFMRYTITLADIKNAICKILNSDNSFMKEKVYNWMNDTSNLADNFWEHQTNRLLQEIIFGCRVY